MVCDIVQTSIKTIDVNPCPDNPRFVEILSQTNIVNNPVDESASKSPFKSLVFDPLYETVDVLVVESLKEIITHNNVAPDVVTFMAQSDVHIKTTQDNHHKEPKSKSASESENSQQKVVIDGGEEQKGHDSEGVKTVSGDDKNSGLESKDDVVIGIEKDSPDKEDDKVMSSESDKEKFNECLTEEEKNDGGFSNEEGNDKESSGADKNQGGSIENVEDMDYDDEPIGRRLAQGIAKILKKRKWKATECQPSKATKKKAVGGPIRSWSKVTDHKIMKKVP